MENRFSNNSIFYTVSALVGSYRVERLCAYPAADEFVYFVEKYDQHAALPIIVLIRLVTFLATLMFLIFGTPRYFAVDKFCHLFFDDVVFRNANGDGGFSTGVSNFGRAFHFAVHLIAIPDSLVHSLGRG